MIGRWRVNHHRLNERLTGCTQWTEFDGLSTTTKVLGGFGNIEDNILRFPSGDVRAIAMRSFDPETRAWSIWWLRAAGIRIASIRRWSADSRERPAS